MAKVKKKTLIWLLIIVGILAIGVVIFFIVQGMSGGRSFKEYETEASAEGISLRLHSVERLPMESEECQERIVLIGGNHENYDCVIANITITNNRDEEFTYNYRNFGYRDPRSDKLLPTALTNINHKGVDVTEDLAPGASHSQELLYSIRKTVNLSDLTIIYRVSKETEISLQL